MEGSSSADRLVQHGKDPALAENNDLILDPSQNDEDDGDLRQIQVPHPGLNNTTSSNEPSRWVPGVCTICLSRYQPHQRVCYSSNEQCEHVFHRDCAEQWLQRLPECPCCRRDFLLDPLDLEECRIVSKSTTTAEEAAPPSPLFSPTFSSDDDEEEVATTVDGGGSERHDDDEDADAIVDLEANVVNEPDSSPPDDSAFEQER